MFYGKEPMLYQICSMAFGADLWFFRDLYTLNQCLQAQQGFPYEFACGLQAFAHGGQQLLFQDVGEESVVSDFHEARRQDMLKEAMNELDGIECHHTRPAFFPIVLVGERDSFSINIDRLDACVVNSDAINVSRQIQQ